MDRNLVLLDRNIARLRRDVRLQSSEIEQLIAAVLDCTSAAQRIASTTLGNSTNMPSPVLLTIRP